MIPAFKYHGLDALIVITDVLRVTAAIAPGCPSYWGRPCLPDREVSEFAEFHIGKVSSYYADTTFSILQVDDTPEPISLVLCGIGLVGLAAWKRANRDYVDTVSRCDDPQSQDLSPDQRLAIESLIGQSLSEHDDVSIRKLSFITQLAPERRQEILNELDKYFARIDSQRQPLPEEEADAIINEALRSTRPDYRPMR